MMTDNSFFASLTPDAQKETNLLLGSGTVGSSDQHHSITGMPSENQTNELFSGSSSGGTKGAVSSDFGSSYDYHQNSPAAQAAIQKLQRLSSAGSQTTTGYMNAASSSDITANDKSALLNFSTTNAVKTTGVFLSRAALPTVSLYSENYDEPGNGGSSSSGGDGGGGSASNPSLLPAGPTGTALADSMNKIFYNSRDQIAHDYHGGSLTQAEMNSCYSEMDHLITHKHWAGFDALHHVEVEISRWASTTQNYQNMIQDVTGTAVTDTDKAWITWAEDTIAKSVGGTSPYTGNTRAYTYQDARYNLVHSDRVTSVINQAYQWELGRAADASGLASQQNGLTNGQTITDIRRGIAFSAECTQDLRNEIVAVTGAQPVDTDNGWIQWVQNTMTDHPGYSLNYARSDLAHSDRVTQIIRNEYQDCLGRDADSSGIQSYENELATGATRGDIHYQLAHSSEAYNTISAHNQAATGITPNSDTTKFIRQIQDEIGAGKFSMGRVAELIDLGARISNVSNSDGNKYVSVPQASPNSYLYTDSQGDTFYMDRRVLFSDVINAGNSIKPILTQDINNFNIEQLIKDYMKYFKKYIGQGGVFDIQRDPSTHIQYKSMVEGANYIVGVFCGAAGLDASICGLVGTVYAETHSDFPFTQAPVVVATDAPYWMRGIIDYENGRFQ